MSVGLHEGVDPIAAHSLSPREIKSMLVAERAGVPFLALRDQDGHLALFVLDRQNRWRTVGRRPEMDVSLSWDSEVSGLHAELTAAGEEWTVVDDGLSTNGTYVNGERIIGRHRLRDGDRIRVGRTVLAYRAPRAAPTGTTVSAEELPALPELTSTQRRVLIALCRPLRDGGTFATPASNQDIAQEVFLSVDAVKTHLRMLFNRLELSELPQNQKRARLAAFALQSGLLSLRDLA
jgi:pSer/pThr/pTyr-binding forkhead associated (FHA) protein